VTSPQLSTDWFYSSPTANFFSPLVRLDNPHLIHNLGWKVSVRGALGGLRWMGELFSWVGILGQPLTKRFDRVAYRPETNNNLELNFETVE